ncbi:MAG TPA: energy transducer TonB [Candidatus Acidoferrum sp.]
MMKFFDIPRIARAWMVLLLAGLFAVASAMAAKDPKAIIVGPERPAPGGPRLGKDLNGVLDTKENLTLRLNTDLGSVRIVSVERGASPTVRYSVHIETDAREPLASQLLERYALNAKSTPSGIEITGNVPPQLLRSPNSAQFWVHFEVTVPASFGLDVNTGAGDIQTADVGGAATLVTEGGNIVTGQLATNPLENSEKHSHAHSTHPPAARLQTQGGHIQVEGAAGDLIAFTAGGHINTGFIHGEANLHSGGGHIRAAGIGGKAELTTEGGNITVGKAGSFVAVKTGGGQIDFGEVRGSVHAQTGGGGIRVMYVSGPMDVESSGGSICLTRVSGAVRAETGSGTITAWINPEGASGNLPNGMLGSDAPAKSVSLSGASQLISGQGDIVVFLPRNLAANIEAIVERGGEHRIEADPALALEVAKSAQTSGPLRALAALNGGGPLLRLKTTGGKIKLQYLESESALWDAMMRDQKARMDRDLTMTPVAEHSMEWPEPSPAPRMEPTPKPMKASEWHGNWVDELELRILGGLREDGDDFQKRIVSAPRPVYPEIARKAGIEGMVRLQVRLTPEGTIEVQKILEGDTVLADAAIAAVKQWRGKPVWMSGKPINVISTVSFEFHLR